VTNEKYAALEAMLPPYPLTAASRCTTCTCVQLLVQLLLLLLLLQRDDRLGLRLGLQELQQLALQAHYNNGRKPQKHDSAQSQHATSAAAGHHLEGARAFHSRKI